MGGFFPISATWETLMCRKGQLDLEFVVPSGGGAVQGRFIFRPFPQLSQPQDSPTLIWSLHGSRFVTPAQVPKARGDTVGFVFRLFKKKLHYYFMFEYSLFTLLFFFAVPANMIYF